MTIAVTCNLSDGVIMGVDSALTIEGSVQLQNAPPQTGILKVYKSSIKLFKLSKFIGISIFGAAMIGSRSIGSYIKEFRISNSELLNDEANIAKVCEAIRLFFLAEYEKSFKPQLEKSFKKDFNSIPDNLKPKFGLCVAGYSNNSPLAEMWIIQMPDHKTPESMINLRSQGNFGVNWFGMADPIRRLIKGYDFNLVNKIIDFFVKKYNIDYPPVKPEIEEILNSFESRILYDAMPLREGIDHVKFLLDVVIHNTRFVLGAPVTDSPIMLAAISRDIEEGFKFIVEPQLTVGL